MLVTFLEQILDKGTIVFRENPAPRDEEYHQALRVLEKAFDRYNLSVAGPLLPFVPATATAAAEVVRQAAWFVVNRSEPEEAVVRRLKFSPPRSLEDHLSADLMLRYLPQLLRRAKAGSTDDVLTSVLIRILREWPLSGVLSDIVEEPLTAADFSHPGLALLYAERLVRHPKAAWLPTGRAREYADMVFHERGMSNHPILQPAVEAVSTES